MSAVLFGASTLLAKLLARATPSILLAGLLYLDLGVGLLAWFTLRRLRFLKDTIYLYEVGIELLILT